MKKKLKNPVFLILGLALLIRLILFFISFNMGEESFYLFDSYRYIKLGDNYFQEGFYAESLSEPLFESIFVTPGGPFVFYFLKSIGGIPMIILFHIFCQMIVCFLLIKTVKMIFPSISNSFIFAVGIFYAIDIPTIVLGNLIMTETLFTVFLFLFTFFYLKFLLEKRHAHLLYASFCLGLSAIIRPIIIYFPFFIIILLIIYCYQSKISLLKPLFFLLFPFYIITGSWVMRNYQVHGYFFYSYIGEFNLAYFQAADIYAGKYNITLSQAREKFHNELQEEFDNTEYVDQIIFYRAAGKKAMRIVIENPVPFLKNMIKTNINIFFRPVRDYLKITLGSKELFHTRSKNNSITINLLTYWQILINIINFILLPFGICYFYKKNRHLAYFFFSFLLYFVLVCSSPGLDARFRVPMEPVLLIIGLAGVVFIIEKITRRALA